MVEVAVKMRSHIDGLQYIHHLIKELYRTEKIPVRKFYRYKLILETDHVRIRMYVIDSRNDLSEIRGRNVDAAYFFDDNERRAFHKIEEQTDKNLLDYIIEKEKNHEIRYC